MKAPYSSAILTLLIFLLAQVFGTLLFFVVGMLLSPDISEAFRAFINGETMGLTLSESPFVSFFAFSLMAADILAVLLCYFLLHNIRLVSTSDIARINWRPGLLGVAGGVLGAMSISVVTEGVELPEMMQQMTLAMSHNVWGLLTLAIIGPIAEELIFREAIEGEMLRRGAAPWVAIIVSALAFSTVHLNLAQGLYALPLGILFGIIYYKTGNILLTALLHILNNSIAAIQLYTMGESIDDTSYADWFGSPLRAYAFTAFSGMLCLVLIKYFWDCYSPCEETKKHGNT